MFWRQINIVSASGTGIGMCDMNTPCTYSRAQSIAVAGDKINIIGKIGAIVISKAGLIVRGVVVDGGNLKSADSSSVLIAANNTTLEDMEIINGWSYGFRTEGGQTNIVARNLNIHHNQLMYFQNNHHQFSNLVVNHVLKMMQYFVYHDLT